MPGKSSERISRRTFLAGTGASGAMALAGCIKNPALQGGSQDSTELTGTISIAGSSTVFPLAEAMREKFLEVHPEVSIDLSSTGTGGGFANYFCPGKKEFNDASRPIKKQERMACKKNDIVPVEIKVATDALTVIVNNDNDFVDCMTVEELQQIWMDGTNKVSKWSDVNEKWPDQPIQLYGPTEASGTLDYFHEAIVGEDNEHRMDHQATENDQTLINGVKGNKYALGYLGFSYYSKAKNQVKALGIDDGNGCVKPSLETAKSGTYKPLSRPLFTYARRSALSEDQVAAFAKFWIKHATSKKIVADRVGYVPLSESERKEQLHSLETAVEKAKDN